VAATGRCVRWRAADQTGRGRWREARASAGTWHSGWSLMATLWRTCRPSCRRGCGCSPPGRIAKPTPPTPIRSLSSRSALLAGRLLPSTGTWWRGVAAAGRAARRARRRPHLPPRRTRSVLVHLRQGWLARRRGGAACGVPKWEQAGDLR
jgi:hypothetical protein